MANDWAYEDGLLYIEIFQRYVLISNFLFSFAWNLFAALGRICVQFWSLPDFFSLYNFNCARAMDLMINNKYK